MDKLVLDVLRSPSGALLELNGNKFRDGNGNEYSYDKGVWFIYDEADVFPKLREDEKFFHQYSIEHAINIKAELTDREQIYAHARYINSEFMFSHLQYQTSVPKLVAEIGVGPCALIQRFEKAGFTPIAVDFYPWEMQQALEAATSDGRPTFACISAPMARLPFADHSLDLVYFHAALHHAMPRNPADFIWCDPVNLVDALTEIRRVLKPRDQGGALFLLGEGIYPESYALHERHYELAVQNQPGTVYEAWYKVSEYEQAYELSGMYPTIFAWQDSFIFKAFGYTSEGVKIVIASEADGITAYNYHLLARHLSRCKPYILPEWITISDSQVLLSDYLSTSGLAGEKIYTQGITEHDPSGSRFFVMPSGQTGYILFGPYIDLPEGSYEALFRMRLLGDGRSAAKIVTDVISNGTRVLARRMQTISGGAEDQITVSQRFELSRPFGKIETRVQLDEPLPHAIRIVASVELRIL